MRSVSSWIKRQRKDFGSRERVVFVVRKWVPPTLSRTHWPPAGASAAVATLLGSLMKALARVTPSAAVEPLVSGVCTPATWLVWELLLVELILLLSGVDGLPRLTLVWTLLLPPQQQLFEFAAGTAGSTGTWAVVDVVVGVGKLLISLILKEYRSENSLIPYSKTLNSLLWR